MSILSVVNQADYLTDYANNAYQNSKEENMEKNVAKFLRQSEEYLDPPIECSPVKNMFWSIQETTKRLRVVKIKKPNKVKYKFVGKEMA